MCMSTPERQRPGEVRRLASLRLDGEFVVSSGTDPRKSLFQGKAVGLACSDRMQLHRNKVVNPGEGRAGLLGSA